MTHWTTNSQEDFAYFVSADFMTQIELELEDAGIEKQQFAARIGVDPSRVSQLIHNPGNLQIDTMVKCSRALSKKMAIVLYDDGDIQNIDGPISGEVFRDCWLKLNQPKASFELESFIAVRVCAVQPQSFYRPVSESPVPVWTTMKFNIPSVSGGFTSQKSPSYEIVERVGA
jgi:hypothetical protein